MELEIRLNIVINKTEEVTRNLVEIINVDKVPFVKIKAIDPTQKSKRNKYIT